MDRLTQRDYQHTKPAPGAVHLPLTAPRLGLYLHFPFCHSKCSYCDFASWAGQASQRAPYTQRLCQEIRQTGEALGKPRLDTVFLGGGTPTMMETGQMDQVLSTLNRHFDVAPDAEITCEGNPATLRADFAHMLRDFGVNRLSLGMQSANPKELALLGRSHQVQDVADSLVLARQAGFTNINLDLMLGLPGQSQGDLQTTLDTALSFGPSHLSCYSLIVEEGTPIFTQVAEDSLVMPSQEEDRALYWFAVNHLQDKGFNQYEISNFCLPGQECRHNLDCWRYQDYLGLGLSASGFLGGRRSKNPDTLTGYLAGEAQIWEDISPKDSRFEQVMLGLRTVEGLSLQAFLDRQGIPLMEAYGAALDKHIKGGLLLLDDTSLRLTPLGFDLMDLALMDFLP